MNRPMRTPVALLIFNRPDTTARVLAGIAKVKPAKLFVFGDGPRSDRPDDKEKCAAAREVVTRVVDWECEVITKFAASNLGCGRGPVAGIGWVFSQVDRAIILEDDCVPQPGFFAFCDELLEKYRDDERVMHIAGKTVQGRWTRDRFSYSFSHHPISWGWATWRRAWRFHDPAVSRWPELRETSWLTDIVEHPRAVAFFRELFDRAYERRGDVDYWDYQWAFACWAENGLSIWPNATLVSNIGFGHPDATHTLSGDDPLTTKDPKISREDGLFPLRHPTHVRRIREADRFFMEQIVLPPVQSPQGLMGRVRMSMRSFLSERPSLRDPHLFGERLRQKILSAIARMKRA